MRSSYINGEGVSLW